MLTLLIVAVTLNCIYIESSAAKLTDALDRLPAVTDGADITELSSRWSKCKNIISLSVNHSETDDIDDSIEQLRAHISAGNDSAYISTLTSLRCQLERLAESEKISADRIF